MKLCVLAVMLVLEICRGQQLRHDGCTNRCFLANDYTHSCQCDSDCENIGNCCSDFWTRCRGTEYGLVVTTQEMRNFSQEIWNNDVNRIANALYSINYQGKTTFRDKVDEAPGRLIVPVDSQLDDILASPTSTYHAFIRLLNNYDANVQHHEYRPAKEIQEEDQFWNVISQTKVMKITFDFLVHNGFIKGDMHAFRTVFNELWFQLYPKAHATVKSDSGFEHAILGEIFYHHANANRSAFSTVNGFNNWVHYYQQQKFNHTNYEGYYKHIQNPNVADIRFQWRNAEALSKTFFVGTSPEFDMALYTVCALAYPNKPCPVVINQQHLNIYTSVARHGQVEQVTAIRVTFHTQGQIVG